MIVIPEDILALTVDDFFSGLNKPNPESHSGAVDVDCSHIQRVTSAHIKLLWQVRLRLAEAGFEINLKSPSADLIRVLRLLDLYDVFMGDEPYTEQIRIMSGPINGQGHQRELELKFKLQTQEIDKALVEFRRFLEELRITGTPAFELETAFYEVATNIRLHSSLSGEDQVEFKAQCLSDRLLMRFIDPGKPFEFDSRKTAFDPRQALNDGQKRGFGLIMINRMTDDIRYERRDQRFNVLTLEKVWSEANG